MQLLNPMFLEGQGALRFCLSMLIVFHCGCHRSGTGAGSSSSHQSQDSRVGPRQDPDAAEIKTGRVFEQGGLKIEVLGVEKHPKRWDWHHPARSRFVRRTLVAEPGEEIAV